MGRPRKAQHLKVLDGTTRPSRETGALVESPPADDLSPPKWLDAGAKRRWLEWSPSLESDGRLQLHDLDAFAALCDSASKMEALGRQATATLLRREAKTSKVYPLAVSMLANYRKMYLELSKRFGMSPGDRGQLKLPKKEPEKRDPAAKFVG